MTREELIKQAAEQFADRDYYATDPIALELLAARINLPRVICEPACGEGHLAKWLTDHGYKVYASDIVDRAYGQVQDFFTMEQLPSDCKTILIAKAVAYLVKDSDLNAKKFIEILREELVDYDELNNEE